MKYSIRAKPERVEVINGNTYYYKYGKLNKIVCKNELIIYYKEFYYESNFIHKNKRYVVHREDGPAVICQGASYYFLNGKHIKIIIKKTNKLSFPVPVSSWFEKEI